jgi:hypothetical protein
MKRISGPFLRTVLATALYAVLSTPFFKFGSQAPNIAALNLLVFAIPVFIAMVIYDFIADKSSLKRNAK